MYTQNASLASARHASRRHAGFTLVELMITVVILAIVVSIAMPSYSVQVRKSRRTEARTALLDLAGRLPQQDTSFGVLRM